MGAFLRGADEGLTRLIGSKNACIFFERSESPLHPHQKKSTGMVFFYIMRKEGVKFPTSALTTMKKSAIILS